MNDVLETSVSIASSRYEDKLDAMLAADDLLYEIEEQRIKQASEKQSERILNRLFEKDDQRFLENEAKKKRLNKSLENVVKSFHSKFALAPSYQPSQVSLEEARVQYLALKQPKKPEVEVVVEEKPTLTLHRGRGKFRALERVYAPVKKSWYEKFIPKVRRLATAAGLVAMLVPSMSLTPLGAASTLSLSPVRVEKVEEENRTSELEDLKGIGGIFKNYVIAGSEPYLTSSFGKRDLPKKVRGSMVHLGNDYRARVGDRNISPIDGTVVSINRSHSLEGKHGMSIAVLSPDSSLIVKNFHGYISKNLKVGSKVKAGDTLSIVAPKKHSGVDPHSHWEAIAVGGRYKKVAGQHVDVFCLAVNETKEKVIKNLESRLEKNLDLPTGLNYLPGRTVREKMENSCELESYRVAYGGSQLPTQIVSSKRLAVSPAGTGSENVY